MSRLPTSLFNLGLLGPEFTDVLDLATGERLRRRAAAFQRTRRTPPMTAAEISAVVAPEQPPESGLRLIDHDLETIALLEKRPGGKKLSPKKLLVHQREIMNRRAIERVSILEEMRNG